MTSPATQIKIEIEFATLHLRQAVISQRDAIEKEIDSSMKRLVEEFDFAAVVKENLDRQLKLHVINAVNDYFSYGKGGEILKQELSKAFKP